MPGIDRFRYDWARPHAHPRTCIHVHSCTYTHACTHIPTHACMHVRARSRPLQQRAEVVAQRISARCIDICSAAAACHLLCAVPCNGTHCACAHAYDVHCVVCVNAHAFVVTSTVHAALGLLLIECCTQQRRHLVERMCACVHVWTWCMSICRDLSATVGISRRDQLLHHHHKVYTSAGSQPRCVQMWSRVTQQQQIFSLRQDTNRQPKPSMPA